MQSQALWICSSACQQHPITNPALAAVPSVAFSAAEINPVGLELNGRTPPAPEAAAFLSLLCSENRKLIIIIIIIIATLFILIICFL